MVSAARPPCRRMRTCHRPVRQKVGRAATSAEQIRFGLDLLEDVLNMSRSTSLYSLNFDHATWLRLQLTTVADVKGKFGLPCQYQSTIITEQVLSVGAIDHVVIELSPRAVQHVEKMAKAFNESELAYDRNFGKGKTLRCVWVEPIEELRLVCMADQGARNRTGKVGDRGTGQHGSVRGQTIEITKFIDADFLVESLAANGLPLRTSCTPEKSPPWSTELRPNNCWSTCGAAATWDVR